MSDPDRCDATWPDPTTPSGETLCMFELGHDGRHAHENQIRRIEWLCEDLVMLHKAIGLAIDEGDSE